MKRSEITRRPLPDTTLSNLESEKSEYRERDSGHLYFRVKSNGLKDWQFRYKKKYRTMDLAWARWISCYKWKTSKNKSKTIRRIS